MKESFRKKSPYLKDEDKEPKQEPIKFCLGLCQRQFIRKGDDVEIYCPSCDRVLNKKPIKNIPFKDIN